MPPACDADIEVQLLRLHQRQQPVYRFTPNFRTLAVQLHWDDSMLRTLFSEGFISCIRDEMVGK